MSTQARTFTSARGPNMAVAHTHGRNCPCPIGIGTGGREPAEVRTCRIAVWSGQRCSCISSGESPVFFMPTPLSLTVHIFSILVASPDMAICTCTFDARLLMLAHISFVDDAALRYGVSHKVFTAVVITYTRDVLVRQRAHG